MKIKKVVNFKYKLLKLKLIKSRIYKAKAKNNGPKLLSTFMLEQVEFHLKKKLQIIYEYHTNGKEILFVGFPEFFNKRITKILDSTNHSVIPAYLWINGILSNKIAIFRYLNHKRVKQTKIKKSSNVNVLLTIKKKPDLIVIYDEKSNQNIMNETRKTKIPVISLTSNFYRSNFIFVNENKFSDIFSSCLHSIFKKSDKNKK